jgi:signal transduction histidine kinase
MVTGLKLLLETGLQPAQPEERQSLEEAIRLINDLMDRVRRLSVDLRPQMLDDLGLLTALEWHFKRYFKQTGIRVQFKHTPLPERLNSQLETAVFRIVQEALTNVARHAGVKEATVRLWKNEERVGVQVEDHGAGFDPGPALPRTPSTGVSGMKERTELLGGDFTLDSTPGQGTCITVELPLPGSRPAPETIGVAGGGI